MDRIAARCEVWRTEDGTTQRESIQAVSPTVLPATVRRQIFLLLGILVVLVAVGSPSGGMFGIAIPLLLKNKLQLNPADQSNFLALAAIPLYLSPVFGFVLDFLEPFRHEGSRVYPAIRKPHRRAVYYLRVCPDNLVDAPRLYPAAEILFRLVGSAESGLLSTLGQQHTMSGQMSALWNVVVYVIGAAISLLGGEVTDLLEAEGIDHAFQSVPCRSCCRERDCPVRMGEARRRVPTMSVQNVGGPVHPIDDLRRLAKRSACLSGTPHLVVMELRSGHHDGAPQLPPRRRSMRRTRSRRMERDLAASFIPTTIAFGFLCTTVPLRKLLVWGTVIGVTQMIPLLFISSINAALIAVMSEMGLTGGVFYSRLYGPRHSVLPAGLAGNGPDDGRRSHIRDRAPRRHVGGHACSRWFRRLPDLRDCNHRSLRLILPALLAGPAETDFHRRWRGQRALALSEARSGRTGN